MKIGSSGLDAPYKISIKPIESMGMDLMEWKYESCTAWFGIGDGYATLYSIESKLQNKGHAQILLRCAKQHYKGMGKRFGGTIALSAPMKHIYRKLGITEYTQL